MLQASAQEMDLAEAIGKSPDLRSSCRVQSSQNQTFLKEKGSDHKQRLMGSLWVPSMEKKPDLMLEFGIFQGQSNVTGSIRPYLELSQL